MTNQTVTLIYFPLIAVIAILLFSVSRLNIKQSLVRRSVAFYVCLLGWLIMEVLYYCVKEPFWIRYVFDIKLMFVAFIAVSILLMITGFYRLYRIFPSWTPRLLCVVPAITSILALTSPWHGLLRKEYTLISTDPLTVSERIGAPWFYVHTIYSQLLAAAIGVIVIIYFRSLPRAYRRGSALMLASLGVYFSGFIVELGNIDKTPLDFTVICAGICGVMFYIAIIVNGRSSYLNIERKDIFNYLDESVLILDSGNQIVDVNDAALEWFELVETSFENITFEELMERLQTKRKIVRKPAEDGSGEYIYLINTKYPLIYLMRQGNIDGGEKTVGSFVTLSEVTRKRLLVERLREIPGVDAVTGLYNRYGYQEKLRNLDRPNNLPLTVIIGYVDGLKAVNDSMGHETGDQLLRHVSKVILDCCPENGVAARTSGEKFVMVLPECGLEEGKCLMRDIQVRLSTLPENGVQMTVAMGIATKTSQKENFNTLFGEVDRSIGKS